MLGVSLAFAERDKTATNKQQVSGFTIRVSEDVNQNVRSYNGKNSHPVAEGTSDRLGLSSIVPCMQSRSINLYLGNFEGNL
jgi:hypothetical protein